MAVQSQTPYQEDIANGVTTVFPLQFDCEDKDHLIVLIDDVEADSLTWSLANKQVTFTLPPELNKKITFQRNTPFKRERNYQSYDNSFRPDPVNNDFDHIWLKAQELGVADWLLELKIQKFRDDVNLTALEETLEQAQEIRDNTADSVIEVQSNVEQSQTLLADTTSKANQAEASATAASAANTAAQQALVQANAAEGNVYAALSAQTTTVNTALVGFTNGAAKFYPTLAEANADIANIGIKDKVDIGEIANGGTWYKATVGATTLTKSPFDSFTQSKADATTKANAAEANAKIYADQKTALKADGVLGKNLFDKSKVIAGKGLGDTGGEITAAGRNASDFILISPNAPYSFTGTNKVIFYDAAKGFLLLNTGANANVVSPANAVYIRVDVTDANLNIAQAEQNTIKTSYEAFGYFLKSNFISESNLKNSAVTEDKIAPFSIAAKNFKDAVFLNMHNPAALRKGFSISFSDGLTETVTSAYDITEYIPCLPNTQYSCSTHSRVFSYRKDGSHISNAAFVTPFNTPADCYQMRFQISNLISNRFQVNVGAIVATTQQPYKFELPQLYIKPQTKAELNAITARKYSFSDAWLAWLNGEKFPICFLGDSTTNGNGTTGYVARPQPYDFTQDYIAPNSYCAVLQNLIQEATGNSTARIYNAGFSGQNTGWALTNIDAIMGSAYADTKMMGISGGINDRTSNPKLLADLYGPRLEGGIKWCFDKGIQPFLLTTQPLTIPRQLDTASMSRTEEIVNEIKRNMAAKYNLEIIDVNKFGQLFMQYSSKPLLNNIMEPGSTIHFGNGGHKFTAELLFSRFCKRSIWVDGPERLDFSTQLVKSDIYNTELQQLAVFKNDFKLELNLTQSDTTNRLLQEFYVFNAGKRALNLSAYYANAVVGQYVEVNGVQTTITQQGQNLGTLDLGLHKIKAYSSATTQLDWLGFKLI